MTAGSVGIGRGFIYFYQFWCFEWFRVLKKSVWLSGAQEKTPKTKHPNLDLEITLKRKSNENLTEKRVKKQLKWVKCGENLSIRFVFVEKFEFD